jgi:hypothetical protein
MTRAGTAVGTKVGSRIKVREGSTTSTMEVYRDVTVGDGDPVAIEVIQGRSYVSGRLYTAPPVTPPDPAEDKAPDNKPKLITGNTTFEPIETRTYRGGRWIRDTTDMFQGYFGGANNAGVAFYGEQLRDLKGATIQRARMTIQRIAGGDVGLKQTMLRLVRQKKRPAGAPDMEEDTDGPLLNVGDLDPVFVIPNSWITAMANNTRGGIAVYTSSGNPLMRFSGLGTYSPSFSLDIDWKRLSD